MGPARKKLRLDELRWKSVDVPRLDDYEGFFGLEEIDDVDVVKDVATGTFSFASRNQSNHDKIENGNAQSSVSNDERESEFEGFSDGEVGTSNPKSILRPTEQKTTSTSRVKAKDISRTKGAEKATKPNSKTAKSSYDEIKDHQAEDFDTKGWKALHLAPDTLAGLARLKYASPTPIQSATIPAILSGEDVIGKASTGSGKTLAFGIPMFETWLERPKTKDSVPLGLVVSPTRELAHQISQHLLDLSKGLPSSSPVVATITGGLSIQKQQRLLNKADIIVGTPGRLWEVIGSSHEVLARVKQVKYLVLDEADRLLSQGHYKDLEELLQALDRVETSEEPNSTDEAERSAPKTSDRQTLVFSATFQKDLQNKLARKQKGGTQLLDKKESMDYLLQRLRFQGKPKFVDVNPIRQMAANLKEGIVEAGAQEKDLYLYAIQMLHPAARTLVFVNSISSVRRLVPFLQNLGLPALPLHSQMPQKARLRSVERFTSSSIPSNGSDKISTAAAAILVATDVAARGLDIPNIDLVLHYHLPRASDAYIHRSGRTARAGASGSSILLCSPDEVAGVRRLIARVHASSAASSNLSRADAAQKGYMIRSLDIDRRVVQRLRPRTDLAKRIADVASAKEKKSSGDQFFRAAAEELGVEYDSEELEKAATGRKGRGSGRRSKERADRDVSQSEVRAMRAELKSLLGQRVNVGVSERYPASGIIDIEALLKEDGMGRSGEFLGNVQGLDMDD